MKQLIAGIAAIAFLASVGPALADNHDHRGGDQGRSHGGMSRQAPPPRHHFREGQSYNGHRLTNRNGHWGYYQPRNGSNIFISIPL
jgi:hypothetical protein